MGHDSGSDDRLEREPVEGEGKRECELSSTAQEKGRFRYFHLSSNNAPLPHTPVIILTLDDLTVFADFLESRELPDDAFRCRSGTQWEFNASQT